MEKYKELLKFIARYVLLIGVPYLAKYLTGLQGEWGAFFTRELPVVLPLLDRWLHLNKNIPVNGIVPF